FKEYRFALLVGILGGISAVLVDLDHIPSAFWAGIYRYLLFLAISLVIITHILEDFILNWF
ncbi:MAG: hypothetical protein NT098_03715, partial [Candidatus Parcubacteria bacterium]|nr:hypothetical protein [Candidatus Parcubacteria bacterium]